MSTAAHLLPPDLLEKIHGLSLVARRVVEGALHGLHRSPHYGLSIEFVQHRQYTPGDELKHLDWQVLARSDRYVIKQYEQETNLRAVLLLDTSASMAYTSQASPAHTDSPSRTRTDRPQPRPVMQPQGSDPAVALPLDSKFDYARLLTAALGYLLLGQGDSVALMAAGRQITSQVPPRAASGHILAICHRLMHLQPAGRTDLPAVCNQLAARLKRRSLVILVSDLFDDPHRTLNALGQLHHRGHEVILFQTLDPREVDFHFGHSTAGITVVRDMETGDEFEVEPTIVRELVADQIQRFNDQLDAGARRHGIHLVRTTTDQPIDQVLTRYLNRRSHGYGKKEGEATL